ncbi:DUF533 domain-containing protein [Loktanella sp. IMCC34160]|uniref:tellurite resistance TerB family protein n=1 Tax=Loktanella sp. IMCC34160 TaxID=2510646 RepID=UPI0013EB6E6B|nr:DUF533 domain-containing protein [Loktanella sp. IMCC34160]
MIRKFISSTALALTLSVGLPSAANAGVPYGYFGDLTFVAETSLPGPDGNAALCHYTTKYHLGYLGFWRSSNGYVLSPSGCEGDSFRAITYEQMQTFQKLGMISADLPTAPSMTGKELLSGFAGTAILGMLALMNLISTLRHNRPGKRRRKAAPQCAVATLAAMCHVAKADGHVDETEITAIGVRVSELTGHSFSRERIAEMIHMADDHLSPHEYVQFGADLSEADRRIVLEGALGVAVADGEIHQAEHAFITNLAQALGVRGDEFRLLLGRLAAGLGGPTPA